MASPFHIATEEAFGAAQSKERGAREYDREVITFRLAEERYGLDITHRSALLPGAVYTTLRRLEKRDLVRGHWEDPAVAALASEYLASSSVILVFYGLYFVSFRALQAAGDMNSRVTSCGASNSSGRARWWRRSPTTGAPTRCAKA